MGEFDLLAIGAAVVIGATSGLRVTLPLLIVSLAANGILPLGVAPESLPDGMAWMGTSYGAWALGGAYALERAIYFVPILDNVTDWIGIPLAPVAGTGVAVAMLGSLSSDAAPMASVGSGLASSGTDTVPWVVIALVAGIPALVLQVGTTALRLVASVFSFGCFNSVVSILEDVAALVLIALAVFFAVLAIALLIVIVALIVSLAFKLNARRRARSRAQSGSA